MYRLASQGSEQAEPQVKTSLSYLRKHPIKVGADWWAKETSTFDAKISVPIRYVINTVDEVITVPVGTFKECLKIKGIGFTEKKDDDNSEVRIDIEIYAWYTPGVGLTKMIGKEKRTWRGDLLATEPDSRQMTMQLETFK